MKEKDWSQEPIKLIRIIRNIVKSQEFDSSTEVFDIKDAMNNLPKMNVIKKVIVKKLAKPNITTYCSGVEITTEKNAKARAVFNGEVMEIQKIKGAEYHHRRQYY